MSDVEQFQMTKPAPVIWAHVVTPRPERRLKNGETVEPAYQASWLFPPDHPDLPTIRSILAKAIAGYDADSVKAKIEANKAAGRAPYDDLKFPLTNGDKTADRGKATDKDREFCRGMAILQGKSNVVIKAGPKKGQPLSPPRLVVLQNGKYIRYQDDERPLAKRFFYSGVLAIGTFGFVPYAGMGGGVSAYLNEILSLNVGEKIATGVDDEAKYGSPDTYKGYVGHVSAVNPLDDEIPF